MRAKGDRKGKFLEYAATESKMYENVDDFDLRMSVWEGKDDLIVLANAEADIAEALEAGDEIDEGEDEADSSKRGARDDKKLKKKTAKKKGGKRRLRLKHNQFSDKTVAEIKEYNNLKIPKNIDEVGEIKEIDLEGARRLQETTTEESNDVLDLSVEGSGVVLPVKDQQTCGSCWAFTATSVLEGTIRGQKKNLNQKELSTQQLIDCTHP